MQVVKQSGQREQMNQEKLLARIEKLMEGLDRTFVQPAEVVRRVYEGAYDGVSTQALDSLAAETAAALTTLHPDYALLAGRIAVSQLHKNTSTSFAATMQALCSYVEHRTGEPAPLVSAEINAIIQRHAEVLDAAIDYTRDYSLDYFGYKTLERSYLMRMRGQVVERPQHLWMRVAIGIHRDDIQAALETYQLMSDKWFTHATPTLFNAGTLRPQLSSCFLLTMQSDSIPGIYKTLQQCAEISQSAGGIGLSIHDIRAKGSYIKGTAGESNGIVPMLRVFNDTARYVDQGGGKRKGAFAIYLEPWHADVYDFLDLKKNTGKEEQRARDLFYALWIPDLFMQRVKDNGDWSLFDPNEAPGLMDVHSAAFDKLYLHYEAEGRARRVVKAQHLWFAILDAQIETGQPYMLYKDHANRKSNQQNLGTIRSSNLCTEIIEYTSPDEIAVCNLASLALSRFVHEGKFDFDQLHHVTQVATRNLNRIIDINFYPVPEARRSNLRHRPIGLGVQGLADAFMLLDMPFESEAARQLNRDIFETIYHAALTASCALAQQQGTYETYAGSPASQGQLQYDLWGVTPSTRWDWAALKKQIAAHGLRNSLLVAPMPTASTSQILGNNECIEPYTSNLYTRRVLSGEFVVVNKHLVLALVRLGLWNEQMRQRIIAANGSIAHIQEIPDEVRQLYKTVWEIKQKTLIDLSADRGAFICQSQSLNLFVESPNYAKLSSMHFYGWERGLKTGMYYLRTKAAADAIKFTVDRQYLEEPQRPLPFDEKEMNEVEVGLSCRIDDPNCETCSA